MFMCQLTIDHSQVTVWTRGNWIPVGFWGQSPPWSRWRWSGETLSTCDWSPTPPTMTSCPIPSGVSAPFPADLFQNVSFSPRLCCLFCRSLSLCCERLRLLVLEVNLTNLWIFLLLLLVLFSSLFTPCYVAILASKLDMFFQRLFFKKNIYLHLLFTYRFSDFAASKFWSNFFSSIYCMFFSDFKTCDSSLDRKIRILAIGVL